MSELSRLMSEFEKLSIDFEDTLECRYRLCIIVEDLRLLYGREPYSFSEEVLSQIQAYKKEMLYDQIEAFSISQLDEQRKRYEKKHAN